jgi:crotonobetainyl-CoA:carnitine CoA-transferase CaiB-like acyl-CoA transferase
MTASNHQTTGAGAPLAGIRVIELGTMITAPLAGMMLADMGADVIKVERPEGDPFRSFNGGLYSPHFAAFNRNKRSVTADLQTEEGRRLVEALVASSDVLIDNFRPGVLKRLSLDPETLRSKNPRLIHCSITGFGDRGPYASRPAYDTVGQALSGIAGLSIDKDEPVFSGTTISDNVTGMYACNAILAILVERGLTGIGRRVEINMLEASSAFMPDAFMNYEMLGLRNDPLTRVAFSQAFVVNCADDRLLALHLSSQNKFWQGLVRAIGKPALALDARFVHREGRIQNYLALRKVLNEEFRASNRQEWLERLTAEDIPCAPVQLIDEVLADRQMAALQSFRDLELPDGRVVRAIQEPVLIDGCRLQNWRAAPVLGEHTSAVTASTDASPPHSLRRK